MQNEKGYALVLVLLIITITFTFALSLSGMALSARKQFNKTDEINRATDLAEMGVAHYEALLTRIVENANAEAGQAVQNALDLLSENPNYPVPDYDQEFNAALAREVNKNAYLPLDVNEDNSYQISNPVINRQASYILITFDSKGKTVKEEMVLKGKLTIKKSTGSRAGESVPEKTTYVNIELEDFELKGGKQEETYSGNTFFNKTVTLRGNTGLFIKGDTFFNSHVILKGGDTIIVHGDAIFNEPLSPDTNGNSSVCVLGTPYRIENQKLVEYTPFDGGDIDSCPQAVLNNEWSIDPDNGMEVTY
ncbi:hypothetical protein [Bacillus sp. ISL-39]|uniref:hypothetical protein n=1 Tax=Bacillus sp. ISL-39 TaxID=2819124 RepID=UPI001BEB5D10|nr:hypothetical protein [Bacillus sp. ISL-39]MBT2636343.1 hypothetical protein [Bacillus sp. ISL-39]